MKILFINPSLRGGKKGHLFLPVGLAYVMTYVKQFSYKFDLLDIDAGGYDDKYVEKYFIENKFDVICMGSIVTHYRWMKWCINTIKKHQPKSIVVVGNSGKILTSTDGISWTTRTSGTTSHLQAVSYEAGKFIAVGQSGRIITSTDGISWTLRTSGISTYLFGVTYGNNNYVTVGASGKILTSQDGTSWTTRTSGTTNSFIGINFVEDLFIAVGESGIIFTSPDGRDWTSQDSGTSEYIRRLTND